MLVFLGRFYCTFLMEYHTGKTQLMIWYYLVTITLFCGILQSFSGTNDPIMTLSAGTYASPTRWLVCTALSGVIQSSALEYSISGITLLREAELSGTGVLG